MESDSTPIRTGFAPAFRFILVAAIVIGIRLPTVNQVVVDWDESVYLVVAQDLVGGGELYRTVWDHKGPFLYASLMPVVWLFDGEIVPIRWYATIWVLATMFFVDLIGRDISSSDWSFVGALVYGLFFSVPRFGGLAANGELFMMLPATIAIWLALRWVVSQSGRWLLSASGLFAAGAVFIKSTALFSVAVIAVLIIFNGMNRRWTDVRRIAGDFAVLASLPVCMFVVILGWFSTTGRLHDYLFATFGFNRAYVAGTPLLEAWHQCSAFFAWAAVGDVFTALALVGGAYLLLGSALSEEEPWIKPFVIALGLFSFLGVISARNMFFHYYLQMALPIAVVITIFTAALGIARSKWRRLAWIALVLGTLSAFSPHRFDKGGLTRTPRKDNILTEVAAFVDAQAGPEEKIFVLGGDPVLYFLSRRRAPTKYFFWLYLTDRWDAILDSRTSVLAAFADTPPEWFVYAPQDLRVPEIEDFMFSRYARVQEIGNYQIARLVTP
jgi:4-amino-4-deoxy-L-arabinose transferase-like glycosyltransferase